MERTAEAKRITWVGFAVNIFLAAFKLFAGYVGRSSAILADGVHSLSDIGTDVLVILGFRVVAKPVDKSHDYGHGKVETLIAAIVGIFLGLVGFGMLWDGAVKIYGTMQGEIIPRPGWIALAAAVLSIASKEALYRYTVKIGNRIASDALIANAWHHRSDALSSISAVFGIGGAILLGEKWRVLDPAAAILVSLLIVRISFQICANSFKELTEASLSDETEKRIIEIIESIPGAIQPHNMKTRKIGNNIAVDIHIKVDPSLNVAEGHDISTKVEERIREEFGSETFISVHIEPKR